MSPVEPGEDVKAGRKEAAMARRTRASSGRDYFDGGVAGGFEVSGTPAAGARPGLHLQS